ncbi:MAG: hypothetical protein EBE86_010610 [Hormoscilla sp. GUM202]|nr:hypothetical protein [Hormoscilla sp. GM7CHS1pb]MBO1347807.1 hypothetical protein [Hormoscilla sp. GUM202]
MMVTAAIAGKSSFNIIHLDSMQKVDIFLLDKQQPLAESEMQRSQRDIPRSRDLVGISRRHHFAEANLVSDGQCPIASGAIF